MEKKGRKIPPADDSSDSGRYCTVIEAVGKKKRGIDPFL
jgi:hypothetical protein